VSNVRRYPGVFEYFNQEQFIKPLPTSRVLLNTYWICTDDDFMRSKKGVWQFHVNKGIAESISSQLPGTVVKFMEYVYIPENPN
jgi:hypothetical protein